MIQADRVTVRADIAQQSRRWELVTTHKALFAGAFGPIPGLEGYSEMDSNLDA